LSGPCKQLFVSFYLRFLKPAKFAVCRLLYLCLVLGQTALVYVGCGLPEGISLYHVIVKTEVIFMGRLFIAIAVLGTAVLFCNCNPSSAQGNLDEAKKAIAESNAIYFESFVSHDSSIFINRYAADCCIMPPNWPMMCGSQAPLEFYQNAYNQIGVRNGKFITREVYGVAESFVAEVGQFQLFDANKNMLIDGKYLVLWKKTAKGWKMFRDSFSSNSPVGK